MLKIRHAKTDDVDKISDIEQKCFPPAEAAGRAAIERRVKAFPSHFWLLFDCAEDGKEQGLVSFINGMTTNERNLTDEMYENESLHDENGKWQMIFGVDTNPAFQHRGYASRLMEQVVSDCKKSGRRGIVLTCKEKLRGFYERFGFACEGVSSSVHGGAVWLQMRLEF